MDEKVAAGEALPPSKFLTVRHHSGGWSARPRRWRFSSIADLFWAADSIHGFSFFASLVWICLEELSTQAASALVSEAVSAVRRGTTGISSI